MAAHICVCVGTEWMTSLGSPPSPVLCVGRQLSEPAEKRKSMLSISMNVASAGLIVTLNWVNRIVYLKGKNP